MSTGVRTAIDTNAQGPKSIETDGLKVVQHSIREQIEADRYDAKVNNRNKSKLPIRVGRFKPGSAAR